MTGTVKTRAGIRSAPTREKIRSGALERGQVRTSDLQDKVRKFLKAIEQEMADNEGIYPHNKGALSKAEVARRAGIHPTTFCTPKQRTLGKEVQDWLDALKEQKVVGRGPVRRELATRIADWKLLYDGLAQAHRDTELELQQTQGDLEQAHERIEKLKTENEGLKKLLGAASAKNIVPMRPKKD